MWGDLAWRLGVGVLLAWAALPLLLALARRQRGAAPSAYYRTLVAALAIATAVLFAPLVRGWTGGGIELTTMGSRGEWVDTTSILFVADLVSPLLGSRARPWHTMPLAHALSAVAGLWCLLFVGGVLYSLAGRLRLWRTYGKAALAPPRVLERAARIATELGTRLPPLRVADGLASAFTFGVFSPVVVLGSSTCQMPEAELDFVLRHELCHVARADARAVFWLDLAQRCFAGHPCLRPLAAEIRFTREASVDETAAGAQPLEYARFLLTMAEHLHSARAPSPSLVSMADTALKRRVEMLMITTQKSPRRPRGFSGLGLSGLALGALVFLAPASWGQGNGAAGGGGRPSVSGKLSVERVEEAMSAQLRPFLDCYRQLPQPRATLNARLQFEIGETGGVGAGNVDVAEHPELEACMEAALLGVPFPAPSSGTVTVDFPLQLTPALAERSMKLEVNEGVSQRLAPEVIRSTVRSYYAGFRTCYDEVLAQPNARATKVRMDFTIGRQGNVIEGRVESLDYPALGVCVDRVMRSMVFPAPEDGIVTVGYPIAFAPG